MTTRSTLFLCLILLLGCETTPPSANPVPGNAPAPAATATKPIAYINGQTVTNHDLQALLIETAGGQALSEIVLDRMIRQRLAERNLTLTPDLIEQEKANMLATLSPDPDEAVRLLNEMRSRRGLGKSRFDALLYRNAGLRLIVKDQAEVAPALVFQAYQLRHGERYRVRIIVADSMAKAGDLLVRAKEGEPFSDLAALHSTDASAAQGGLLSPVSPADTTYPAALRKALENMRPGTVSDLIAVDDHFIIMKLEEKLPADPISFVDAREVLEKQVRMETQAQLMQQTARAMLAEAKVVILDPALNQSWRTQQDRVQSE